MSDDNVKVELRDEEEKSLLLDHDYDGIHEFNYPLPSWWVWTWAISIIFSVLYLLYYQMGGLTLREEFKAEWTAVQKVREESAKSLDKFEPELYATISSNPEAVANGKVVYEDNCLACHAENGKGDIGPNLTDKYWLQAKGTPESIFPVVVNGIEDNGMPAWGEMIEKDEIYQVIAYVMTLVGTNHPEGKEPQGEPVE